MIEQSNRHSFEMELLDDKNNRHIANTISHDTRDLYESLSKTYRTINGAVQSDMPGQVTNSIISHSRIASRAASTRGGLRHGQIVSHEGYEDYAPRV